RRRRRCDRAPPPRSTRYRRAGRGRRSSGRTSRRRPGARSGSRVDLERAHHTPETAVHVAGAAVPDERDRPRLPRLEARGRAGGAGAAPGLLAAPRALAQLARAGGGTGRHGGPVGPAGRVVVSTVRAALGAAGRLREVVLRWCSGPELRV